MNKLIEKLRKDWTGVVYPDRNVNKFQPLVIEGDFDVQATEYAQLYEFTISAKIEYKVRCKMEDSDAALQNAVKMIENDLYSEIRPYLIKLERELFENGIYNIGEIPSILRDIYSECGIK